MKIKLSQTEIARIVQQYLCSNSHLVDPGSFDISFSTLKTGEVQGEVDLTIRAYNDDPFMFPGGMAPAPVPTPEPEEEKAEEEKPAPKKRKRKTKTVKPTEQEETAETPKEEKPEEPAAEAPEATTDPFAEEDSQEEESPEEEEQAETESPKEVEAAPTTSLFQKPAEDAAPKPTPKTAGSIFNFATSK